MTTTSAPAEGCPSSSLSAGVPSQRSGVPLRPGTHRQTPDRCTPSVGSVWRHYRNTDSAFDHVVLAVVDDLVENWWVIIRYADVPATSVVPERPSVVEIDEFVEFWTEVQP